MVGAAVLGGIGAYLALTLAIGLWAGRRVRGGADFLVAGRRLPLSLATATLFATWFGGGTCVGAAAEAYRHGVPGVIADPFGAALCLFLAGWFYVRPLRRMRILTICDFFRIRFGRGAELLSALLQVPPFLGWAAAQLVAFGAVLQALAGIDKNVAIVIGGVVTLAYTVAGGMWAVALTDALQAAVLVAGLLYLVPQALASVGGFSALTAALPAESWTLLPTDFSASGLLWYAQAWIVIGLGSIPSQDLLQRSLSSRDERVAARSAHLSGALYLTVGLAPVLLGMIATVRLPGLEDPELALPLLGRETLGPAGLAVFSGALLSAILSSADSALLAPASVVSQNLVKPLFPRFGERKLLRTARLAVAAFALISLALALRFGSVYGLMLTAMEAGVAALIAPFTAGIYWRRANAWAAHAGMLVGAAGWGFAKLVWPEYPADLFGMAVSIAAVIAVAFTTSTINPPLPLADIEGRPIQLER